MSSLDLFIVFLDQKMSYSIEASINNEKTYETLFFDRKTTWYPSEAKYENDEILRRTMLWWHDIGDGEIKFYTYHERIYDQLFEYFNLRKEPPSSLSLSTKFLQLHESKYRTEWNFEEGTIRCYHKWCPNEGEKISTSVDGFGEIEFKTNDLYLFIMLSSYVVKFNPEIPTNL